MMIMSKKVFLTTSDNPFNPFNNFDAWFNFDVQQGYNSCQYLARVANTSDSLTDSENSLIIEKAIDEIISLDPFNIFKKIVIDDNDSED